MWQKDKFIVMSNFIFGHNVFKSRLLLLHHNASAAGKALTLSDASAADDICKHCSKRSNCSYRSFSPFAKMFSTLFIYILFVQIFSKLSDANVFYVGNWLILIIKYFFSGHCRQVSLNRCETVLCWFDSFGQLSFWRLTGIRCGRVVSVGDFETGCPGFDPQSCHYVHGGVPLGKAHFLA